MRVNTFILYSLFGINFLCGLALLVYQLTSRPPLSPPLLTLNQMPKILVSDSSHHNHLITYAGVDLIHIKKPYLIIGADSLEYQTVMFSGSLLYMPAKPTVWQNYWAALLGESEPGQDDQRWKTAQQKWRAFVLPELDSLGKRKDGNTISPENQLCHALLHKIASSPTQTFYIHNKMLESAAVLKKWAVPIKATIQLKAATLPNDKPQNLGWLSVIVLISTGLLGVIYIRFTKTGSDLPESLPTDTNVAEDLPALDLPEPEMQPTIDQEMEAIRYYIQCFSERYGDFYQMLENLPEPLTDEQIRMAIKRQLVEMALHAQSFVRVSILAKMQRPLGEPNLLLITNNWQVAQLNPQSYEVFTKDPYKTNKRYRQLQQILAEMNIGNLEGALLHTTYLPAEFLVQP